MKLIEYDRFQQVDDNTKKAIMEWWEPEPFDTMLNTITGEVFQYPPTSKYDHKKIKKRMHSIINSTTLDRFYHVEVRRKNKYLWWTYMDCRG